MLEIIIYIIVFILAWELPSYMAKKGMENKLKDDFYAVLDKAVEYNVSSELILKISIWERTGFSGMSIS